MRRKLEGPAGSLGLSGRKTLRRIGRRVRTAALLLLTAAALLAAGCGGGQFPAGWELAGEAFSGGENENPDGFAAGADGTPQAGVYAGDPYEAVNGNIPYFTEEELSRGTESFEMYSELDRLGRCGEAFASVGQDLMPAESRESISQVKPSGWQTARYDTVDGGYLYNRCHLIGYQLTAENANEKNLITGTRYMNVEGMLPFENMTADYVKETGNHVLYRVTPEFQGDELVARGVLMEAQSVEDGGEGISFCVFVYNVQPGIEIDYATGDSWLAEESGGSQETGENEAGAASGRTEDGVSGSQSEETEYVLNTGTRRFHKPDCSSVKEMKQENRENFFGTREELLEEGYEPCGRCRP